MDLMFYGLVAVLGLGTLAGAIIHYRNEKRRSERLRELAGQMGFTFISEGDRLSATGLGQIPLFNRGHSQKASNVLHKQVRGTDIYIFDYRYVTGGGKNRATHRFLVAAFYSANRTPPPDFEMQPENVFHRIGALFGYHDIDFESHPAFSRKYLVRGQNEPQIRDAFHDAILNHFESLPKTWCVESRKGWVAIYQSGSVQVEALAELLATTTKIYLLFAPESGVGEHSEMGESDAQV